MKEVYPQDPDAKAPGEHRLLASPELQHRTELGAFEESRSFMRLFRPLCRPVTRRQRPSCASALMRSRNA
jgi:hypothetical protein